MKKIIPLLLILAIGATQCNTVDEYTQFEMEYQTTVIVPSSLASNSPFDMWTPEVTTNSEAQFAVNDTRKDKVEDIRLRSTLISVTSPESSDFSFLNDIYVYLNADGLPEVEIARKEDIPDDVGSELELTTSDDNLEAYIKKDKFKMRVKTVTDELISEDHEVQIDAVYWVDAEVVGQ
jgi:hypothetical protein